ncbi:MAG: cytochrome b/b6 domain-containing protein [Chloroflexota bacterium]
MIETRPRPTTPAPTSDDEAAPVQSERLPLVMNNGEAHRSNWLDDNLLAEEHILEPDARGRERILRQPPINRIVHWLVALSTFSLFFSGFGQMPLYKRYMLSNLPGMAWTADYSVTLLLHYLGAAVLIFAVAFHAAYHGWLRRELGFLPRRGDVRESARIIKAMVTGGAEPPSAKYLAEQRLAYAAIGGVMLLVILTGIVKMLKNLPGVGFSETVILVNTTLHNLAAVLLLLLIVAHLAAFLVPANARLLGAMFHGKVDRAYVEHRHPIWYRQLLATAPTMAAQPPTAPAPTGASLPGAGPAEAVPPAGVPADVQVDGTPADGEAPRTTSV